MSSFQQHADPTNFDKSIASRKSALEFFKNHPTEMTLDNLVSAGLSVYVRNNANVASRIVVDFVINGNKKFITVPNTWIAIKLNEYMSLDDVSRSGSLRDMLRKKVLVLVHPDVAEAEYATERGQRELGNYKSGLAKDTESPLARVARGSEVSDRMKSLVIEYQASVNSGDAEARQGSLDKIFNSTRSFSPADVSYFRESCPDDILVAKQVAEMEAVIESRS